MRLQIADACVNTAAGRRNALELSDHRTALVILELDLELLPSALELHFRVAADETFGLQHVKQTRAQPRVRRLDLLQAPHLTVADAGEKITDRIYDRHFLPSLPARLGHARDLAEIREIAQRDARQFHFPV